MQIRTTINATHNLQIRTPLSQPNLTPIPTATTTTTKPTTHPPRSQPQPKPTTTHPLLSQPQPKRTTPISTPSKPSLRHHRYPPNQTHKTHQIMTIIVEPPPCLMTIIIDHKPLKLNEEQMSFKMEAT